MKPLPLPMPTCPLHSWAPESPRAQLGYLYIMRVFSSPDQVTRIRQSNLRLGSTRQSNLGSRGGAIKCWDRGSWVTVLRPLRVMPLRHLTNSHCLASTGTFYSHEGICQTKEKPRGCNK